MQQDLQLLNSFCFWFETDMVACVRVHTINHTVRVNGIETCRVWQDDTTLADRSHFFTPNWSRRCITALYIPQCCILIQLEYLPMLLLHKYRQLIAHDDSKTMHFTILQICSSLCKKKMQRLIGCSLRWLTASGLAAISSIDMPSQLLIMIAFWLSNMHPQYITSFVNYDWWYFALEVSIAAADRASRPRCLQGWLGQPTCLTRHGILGHVPQVLQRSTSCIVTEWDPISVAEGKRDNKCTANVKVLHQQWQLTNTGLVTCCLPTAHNY